MCAIRDGHSIASSMGFTALDGLPMGTRCGQLDPGVVLYLMQEKKMSAEAIADLLYRESGLKGLSGISHDMRDLEASDRPEAQQAIEYFVFRIRRELGGLAAVLEGIDAIVFCGGIGEHAWRVRERVLEGMEWIGVELDPHRQSCERRDHRRQAFSDARVRDPDRRGGDDRRTTRFARRALANDDLPASPRRYGHAAPASLIHRAIEGQVSFSVRDPMNKPSGRQGPISSRSALSAFRDIFPRRTPAHVS